MSKVYDDMVNTLLNVLTTSVLLKPQFIIKILHCKAFKASASGSKYSQTEVCVSVCVCAYVCVS